MQFIEGRLVLAVFAMVGATVLYGFVPVAIAAGGGAESPLLFNGVMRIGTVAAMVVAAICAAGKNATSWRLWKLVLQHLVSWVFPLGVLNFFEYMLFGWASAYVDPVLVTVVFGCWPMTVMFVLGWLDSESQGRLDVWWAVGVLGCTAGMAVAVFSYGESAELSLSGWESTLKGTFFALGAVGCAGCSGVTVLWARRVGAVLPTTFGSGFRREMLAMMTFLASAGVVAGVTSAWLGVQRGEQLDARMLLWAFGVAGVLGSGVATAMWRISNALTRRFVVNCLGYVVSVVSVVALWLTGFGEVTSPLLVCGGLALVVGSNVVAGMGRNMAVQVAGWLRAVHAA